MQEHFTDEQIKEILFPPKPKMMTLIEIDPAGTGKCQTGKRVNRKGR